MPKVNKYQGVLFDMLRDDKSAMEYLNSALSEQDPAIFLIALREVVQARGGFETLALKTGLSRTSLYKSLSALGNPEWYGIVTILKALGFNLSIECKIA